MVVGKFQAETVYNLGGETIIDRNKFETTKKKKKRALSNRTAPVTRASVPHSPGARFSCK